MRECVVAKCFPDVPDEVRLKLGWTYECLGQCGIYVVAERSGFEGGGGLSVFPHCWEQKL